MLDSWRRVPVIVRAVLAGTVVSAAGLAPWILFASANQKVLLAVPWAIAPTALFLWQYLRYLSGAGWPRSTSESRRVSLRANSLSGEVWGAALLAGMLGLMATLPLGGLMSRLMRLPAESQPISVPKEMPFVTVFMLLVMASVVAGVVEETAFRGYMQGPIERRHGPTVAILVTGTFFGLAHFTHHPTAVLTMLPHYIFIAAVFGGLAWLTNSILPGIVVHAAGDVYSLTRLWATGQPEWQVSPTPAPLVWDTGPDAAFWGYLAAFVLASALAAFAYIALASVARNERHHALA